MSSNVFFWSLTYRDFQNSLSNSIYKTTTFLAGAAVASATGILIDLFNKRRNREPGDKPLAGRLIALGAGIAASIYVANRLPYVTFTAEKSLKLLVLTIVAAPTKILPYITAGGALGYFGRNTLYLTGVAGAIGGDFLLHRKR